MELTTLSLTLCLLTTERKKIINYVAEAGTIKDVGLQLPRCTGFSSFWGMRKVRCTQTNSNYGRETFAAEVPNAKNSRKLRNVVTLQTMRLSHKAAGGAGGGGGGGGGSGVGGGKGGGSGSQSNHQTHKKENNAISLAYPWIYILLEIGIYAIAALPFTLI